MLVQLEVLTMMARAENVECSIWRYGIGEEKKLRFTRTIKVLCKLWSKEQLRWYVLGEKLQNMSNNGKRHWHMEKSPASDNTSRETSPLRRCEEALSRHTAVDLKRVAAAVQANIGIGTDGFNQDTA